MTPRVGVHFVSRPERAELGKRNTEKRHRPERYDLATEVASTAFAPRPRAVELIRGKGRYEVSRQGRPDDARNDAKAVENGDRSKRHSRRNDRAQDVSRHLLALMRVRPGDKCEDSLDHLNSLTGS